MPPRKEAKIKGRAGTARHASSGARAEPAGAASGPAWGDALPALAAAAFAALLYVPTIQYGWVWNDSILVATKGLKGAAEDGYGPAVHLLTRMEWLIGAGQPALFHATSIVLYVVATWLVFRTARLLAAPPWLACGAALLFAAHPAHVEAVAYVSGRSDLLATACALGALALARSAPVLAPGGGRSWRAWLACGLLAIAVLSNEVALAVPFILVALDRWGAIRTPAAGRRALHAGFFVVAAAGVALRLADRSFHAATGHEGVPAGAAGIAPLHATFEYLRLLLWPSNLNAMRSLDASRASALGPVLGALALAAILAALVVWRRSDPLARGGAVLLALPLLPALPLPFFQGAYVAERAATFASVGVALLAASVAAALAPARRFAPSLLVAASIAGAAGTLARLPAWRDDISLLQAAVMADPHDSGAYYRLAQSHLAVGEYDAALTAAERSIAADSMNVDARHLLGVLLTRRGDYAGAEREARRAVAVRPSDAIGWANLGDALTQQGRLPEALDACRRAVALDSTLADNWYNFGVALGSTGDLPGATEAYRRALAIEPRHVQAVNNLGAVLAAQGRLEEARDAYRRAVSLAPGSVETRMNLAMAYIRLGDIESAARERDVVRRQDPALGRRLDELIRAAPPPR